VPEATQGEKMFYVLQVTCNRINGIEHPWGFAKGRKVLYPVWRVYAYCMWPAQSKGRYQHCRTHKV
jgi:hypothetical protein